MPLAPFAGFIGTDIQVQTTENTVIARFRVGVGDRYRDAQGQWVERETFWVTCQAWGNLARRIYHEAKKGDGVLILGRWEQYNYEKDGAQKSARFVTVEHFGLDLAIPPREERQVAPENRSHAEPVTPANVEVENPL